MKCNSILVTAPSGAGKTTLVKQLLSDFDCFSFSVSATTREKRENEVEGKDYFFLTNEEFEKRVNDNDFLEWEEVYDGTKYGTLKSEVSRIESLGKTIIFDIDVKGALELKKVMNEDLVSIFISPPNIVELENRLRHRNTESEEKILTRLNKAKDELKFENLFDFKIVNENIEDAYNELNNILRMQACFKN